MSYAHVKPSIHIRNARLAEICLVYRKSYFGIYKKLVVQMLRGDINTQITTTDIIVTLVGGQTQLHDIYSSFDENVMVL